MGLDILRSLYDGRILDRFIHFPVFPCFKEFSDWKETKNGTLEEIELIFNSSAGGQVRRVFQHSRRGVDGNYDHLCASIGSSGKQSPPNERVLSSGKTDVETSGVEDANNDLVQNVREY